MADVHLFCYLLAGMLVVSLSLSFLGHANRKKRRERFCVYYKKDGTGFEDYDDVERLIREDQVEDLSSAPLDRRQVAVAMKHRLDTIAGFSKPRPA